MRALVLVLLSLAACSSKPAAPPPDAHCGERPGDWCPSPPGDPCGAHPNEATCRADPACQGLPYRGESVVACMDDGHGFWTNCPAVGCVSRR